MAKILFSIIIPTHNSQNTIKKLLLSLNNSRFDHFEDMEVIIIDDCSTDETIETINPLKRNVKYKIELTAVNRNVGPAKARNLGVKKARGKYVLFLDSDVILFPKTLNNIHQALKLGKSLAFTGIWHYRQKTRCFFPRFKAFRDWAYWFIEREKNFRYYLFSTRIACIEKRLFNKIEGFNSSYKEPTVEDIELTYKIEQKTKIEFCPDWLVHHEFEDFWPIAVKYFKRSRDWVQLYRKRLRFDPVATSKKEAFKSVTAGSFAIFLFLSFAKWMFIYPTLISFIIFAYLEWRFWKFLVRKGGFAFCLTSIPVSIVLYLVINLGAFYGLLISLVNK